MGVRLAGRELAPIDAADVAALEQGDIERGPWDFARGEADHEEPALPGERTQGGFGERPADRIVDDVHALGRDLLEAGAQVVGCGVDRLRGAMGPGKGELFLGGSASD